MGEGTRLRELVNQRQWTYQAFEAQFTRAARIVADRDGEPRLARLTTSETTFRRWTGGTLRTRPGADVCRVLEELFQCPAAELFAAPPMPQLIPAQPIEASNFSSTSIREFLSVAARNALRFTVLSQPGADDVTIEALTGEAARLAALYPTAPLHEFLGDLVNLQEITYRLLESHQRPTVQRDLHLIAALSTGLLAKASHDQADPTSAMTLARAAYLAADIAGHQGAKAWVRGIQALAAYWAGWPQQAADFAASAHDEGLTGTVTVWLPALEARAHAALGDAGRARAALARAQNAREQLAPSDLDDFGGLLTFPEAQQTYYQAETLVLTDPTAPEALDAANQAVAAYSDPDAPHWAFGDEAGSRTHQAVALIASGHFDGALDILEPVLNLPAGQRTHGITVCVRRTAAALPPKSSGQPRLVSQIREGVEEFDHTTLKALAR
jgi:hypothetical protein